MTTKELSENTQVHDRWAEAISWISKRQVIKPTIHSQSITPEQIQKVREDFRRLGYRIPEGWMEEGYLPQNSGDILSAAIVTAAAIATVTLLGRVYAKLRHKKRLALDDLLAIIAWAFMVSSVALNVFNYQTCALGYQTADAVLIDPDATTRAALYGFSAAILNDFARYSSKISIIIFTNRYLTGNNELVIRSCQLLFMIMTLFHMSAMLTFGFQCTPPSDFWNKGFRSGANSVVKCISRKAIFHALPILSSVTAWAILILLTLAVWDLRLGRWKSAGIWTAKIAGLGACIATILTPLWAVDNALGKDPLRVGSQIAVTVSSETALLITCGSIFSIVFAKSAQHARPTASPTFIQSLEGLVDPDFKEKPSPEFYENEHSPPRPASNSDHPAPSMTSIPADYPFEIDPLQIAMPKSKYSAGRAHKAQAARVMGEEREKLGLPGVVNEGEIIVTQGYEVKSEAVRSRGKLWTSRSLFSSANI